MNKTCPNCDHPTLVPSGTIKAGPKGGKRTVYYCTRCGYREVRI